MIETSLEDLLKEKKTLEEIQYNLSQKQKEINNKITNITKIIFNKCDHQWEVENVWVGPYDKPDLICKICNSIKYR